MDELTAGLAVRAQALRSHAQALRALSERDWGDIASRLGALGPAPAAFGESWTLASLAAAYADGRADLADLSRRAAGALEAMAGNLDRAGAGG